ncbi:RNA-binding S4 domain-containing protein [Corynebacterium uterequi]|uniref:Ribosome-associated heat shock protein implicated in recycling of 50S subunit n=1 Tax=Corynebacterium uterequi TaxID=1072256 RepID=A0A0G3HFA9_9CORY|nr:RNA-binding S4 domain-containing protein [Corynebacterium uterequi]AKK11430.1 ribosome-associated heat shock protein implicated in recycling of 50S subunit [Corynebacterium uterequi]
MTQPDGRPVRVDAWVWAVRVFKTRSEAAEAVRAGHVKVNGVAVKPAQQVVPGDRVRIWHHHRIYDLEVLATVSKRVGAPVARRCYADHSPPEPPRGAMPVRDRGAGRPTKKERRQLEKLRGR